VIDVTAGRVQLPHRPRADGTAAQAPLAAIIEGNLKMSHALTEQPHALSGAISCRIAHVSHETLPRAAAHISTAVAASAPTAATTGTKILLVVVAFLVAAVAGLIVGLVGHEGNIRKSVLRGLYVFGGTMVGCVVIEGSLGLF
jgi:VIT1/CCC1 family predicted Fe2+/Mn2+ transporter